MTVHHSNDEVMLWRAGRRRQNRGFTLIELIMVIVLMGVLAVFAAPRIFNSDDFNARGFHDENLALLRYAQKTAIAQRRMVCVTFNTAGTRHTGSLMMENPTPPATPMPAVNCTTSVVGPKGESPALVTAKSGAAYASASNLIFDGLGQPVNSARVALSGNTTVQVESAGTAISKTITIESGTGYVHD